MKVKGEEDRDVGSPSIVRKAAAAAALLAAFAVGYRVLFNTRFNRVFGKHRVGHGNNSYRGSSKAKEEKAFSWDDWDEGMEEYKRLERIRRMQEAFHRERSSGHGRGYETWQGSVGPKGPSDQNTGREEWYWKPGEQDSSWKAEKEKCGPRRKSTIDRHYDILGLNSKRMQPYSDAELKAAFRTKAMEFHPDRNQHQKEHAESMFKELVTSYEALKQTGNKSAKDY